MTSDLRVAYLRPSQPLNYTNEAIADLKGAKNSKNLNGFTSHRNISSTRPQSGINSADMHIHSLHLMLTLEDNIDVQLRL